MTEARFDQLRSAAFGTITNAYLPLGSSLAHNWRIWRVVNGTNGDIFISFDGVNDNMFVPANSFILYDIATNADQDAATALSMSIGTQYFVRYSTAPTTGGVYLEGAYQKGQ